MRGGAPRSNLRRPARLRRIDRTLRHSGRAQRDPEPRGRECVVCPWVPGSMLPHCPGMTIVARSMRRMGAPSVHQTLHQICVFKRTSPRGFVEVGGGGVAAVDVLVVENGHAELQHARDVFACVARMDAVVLG